MASERPQPRVWPVGALVRALGDTLVARFGSVVVEGEISGFTRASSGHCYFALRDAAGQLRCVMFRQRAQSVGFDVRDGLRVEVRADIGIYEPRGDLQLNVTAMRPAGQGALLEEFLRLKEKLRAEGLFEADRKRPLPSLPAAVGIVTSPQAAALQDVLATLRRRSPQLRVVIYPAAVQGAAAGADLARAVRVAGERAEVDLLLLVRGGGAIEDLWAFNDEGLARAIAASPLPVVSGVGHETDVTIADFAADLRAATPTAAAELCSPSLAELREQARTLGQRLSSTVQRQLQREQQRLDRMQLRLPTPQRLLRAAALRLGELQSRARHAVQAALTVRARGLDARASRLAAQRGAELARRQARLDELGRRLGRQPVAALRRANSSLDDLGRRLTLLDPAATLARGYWLAWHADGRLAREAAEVAAGERLVLASAGSAARVDIAAVEAAEHPLRGQGGDPRPTRDAEPS